MLKGRLEEYRKHWEAKGKEPPSKNERHEIADGDAGHSVDELFEAALDGNGDPFSGPVEAWPAKGPGKQSLTAP